MSMERWVLKNNTQDFSVMASKLGVSEEIAKIMVYRGVDTSEKIQNFLNMSISQLYPPALLQDMDKAACIIEKKIEEGAHIRIVGDYDVDGIMSTYILLSGLRYLGAKVDFVIPDRVKDGYGINESIIDNAHNDGVDTILTCDNGIAAISQIEHAKELGMTVVVTDHHDIVFSENEDGTRQYTLPMADAVVNPHRPGSKYPYPAICGAVVAYKLICQIYDDKGIDKYLYEQYIEYAGIATVCDIMPLMDENRAIVKRCLEMLSDTNNIGLRELIRQTGAKKEETSKLEVYHLGFIIGPCFNASGRLKTASIAIELLDCKDASKAKELAVQLVELNDERKQLTQEGMERVFKSIDEGPLSEDKVIVAYDERSHESIAGIIAGRVRERYNKPAIVITKANDMCKGSARSIECYNIFEELTKAKEFLHKFGGHPMAAGLSLSEENIEKLRRKLNDICTLTEEDFVQKIIIDVVKNPGDITERFIDELNLLEPFGTGNEKPVIAARNVKILKAMQVGKVKKFLKMELECDGRIFQSIYFGELEDFEKNIIEKYSEDVLQKLYDGKTNEVVISMLYYPQINEFRNIRTIQAVIKSIKY